VSLLLVSKHLLPSFAVGMVGDHKTVPALVSNAVDFDAAGDLFDLHRKLHALLAHGEMVLGI